MPFENLIVGLDAVKYPLVFVLSVVEGPVVMVASGMLYHQGFFSFWPLYLTLILGDFVADLGWYAVGRYGATKFVASWGRYFSITPEAMGKLEKLFEHHHDKILFISKITMGFGFALATLVSAGMARVPFKRYAFYNFVGGFVWTGILLSAGYFFGNLYALLDKGFRWAFVVFVIAMVLLAMYGGGKYFRKKLFQGEL